jgi:hypothetical protein
MDCAASSIHANRATVELDCTRSMKLKVIGELTPKGTLPWSMRGGYRHEDTVGRQLLEPVRLRDLTSELMSQVTAKDPMRRQTWVFRNRIVQVEDPPDLDHDDRVIIQIKHMVLREEKALAKMKREVELFEKFEKTSPAPRKPIPEDVRIFVWRRDEGKCVRCGSRENIEFDHIIPVVEGGSNRDAAG